MTDFVLRSKLLSPSLHPKSLVRQRLIECIDANRTMTSIVAPAGYGKTTLITHWQEQTDNEVRWLSLDEGDNEPEQFVRYFITMLRSINQDLETHLEYDSQLPLISNALIQYLNQPVHIVLDNYHLIEQERIHAIIDFFIIHPVPQLHFIIISRSQLPFQLAQARIQQQISEIAAYNLKFTQDEIRAYFELQHALNLSSAQYQAIEEVTQGWIASIQVLALRLNDSTDIDKTLETFSGKDQYLVDYFMNEFLVQYSDDTQSFLIYTSILDTLNADLCDAVLQRDDSDNCLVMLEEDGLPIISLDTTQSAYRYHPLFAHFLKLHLESEPSDHVSALHERASDWYASQDDVSSHKLEQALVHARFVSQEKVLNLLTRFSLTILQQGYNDLFLEHLRSIPYATLFDYPRVLISYLWSMYIDGQIYKTSALLEEAERILPMTFMGEIYALRTQLSSIENNPQKSRQLATHALKMLSSDDMVLRGLMQFTLARLSFFYDGQTNQAIKQVTEAILLFEQAKHYSVWSVAVDCLIAIRQRHGSLLEAEALCRYGIATCEKINRPDFLGTFYSQLGKILYERNFLSEAENILRYGRGLSRKYDGRNSFLAASLTLSRIVNQQEADVLLEETRAYLQTEVYQIVRIASFPTSHLAEHGWISPWIDWNKHDYDPKHDKVSIKTLYTYLDFARRLCIGKEPNPRKAITLLLELEQLSSKINQRSSLLEVLILLAFSYKAVGNKASAQLSLQRALLIAQHTEHRRLFLDLGEPILDLLEEVVRTGHHTEYARQLLDSQENPIVYSTQPDLTTPLTSRELDILRLLSDGYSNPEISRYFDLSVSTVRWHVKNIYRKLDVNNRTRATLRARDLGII